MGDTATKKDLEIQIWKDSYYNGWQKREKDKQRSR
jgi:hypothetical protein